jgi:BirA family transcriptional regulator, biotin operon repressor / biotin---[acetyl-CoA-carboxylase] ligase
MSFGSPRRHLRSTDSTNDRARELVEAGAPSGAVVTAAEQTAGRGRSGRRWSAPPGKALLVSATLHPLDARHRLLPLAVPLAVCDAIEVLAPVRCGVKWPNDIWIEERKVAGVLIEARPPEWAVIGAGVNLAIEAEEFPGDLRWPATSVGHGVDADGMLGALCAGLDTWVDARPELVIDEFRERDALAGREVSWEKGAGIAAGIDDDGNLVVEREGGEREALGAGEVQLRLEKPG